MITKVFGLVFLFVKVFGLASLFIIDIRFLKCNLLHILLEKNHYNLRNSHLDIRFFTKIRRFIGSQTVYNLKEQANTSILFTSVRQNYWKKKSKRSRKEVTSWKWIQRTLQKSYKKLFLVQIFHLNFIGFQPLTIKQFFIMAISNTQIKKRFLLKKSLLTVLKK